MSCWCDQSAKGCDAGAEEVHPELGRRGRDDGEGVPQVGDRLPDGVADAGDDLDGVAQQLLVQPLGPLEPTAGELVHLRGDADRSRLARSTSASSHSTPSVGSGDAWKSMRMRRV